MQNVFNRARALFSTTALGALIEVVLDKAEQHFNQQPQWPVLYFPQFIGSSLGLSSEQQEALGLINLLLFCYADITDDAEDHDLPAGWIWGWEQAVNIGNTLLFACFQQIAQLQVSERQRLELLKHYSQAGFQMTLGQAIDLRNAYPQRVSQSEYFDALRGKSGGSLAVFAAAPAVVAGSDAEIVEGLWAYGENVGTFLQLVSDIRDPDADLRNGCLSLPLIFLLESLPEEERLHLEEELAKARRNDPYSLSRWLGSPEIRLYVEIKAEVLRQRAVKALDVFDEKGALGQGLRDILSLSVYSPVSPLL